MRIAPTSTKPTTLATPANEQAPAAASAPPSTIEQAAPARAAGDIDRMERPVTKTESPAPADVQHAKTIDAFYEAFARRDGAAMAAMYHPDAVFHDEAFGTLKGQEIGAMWMMLTKSAPKLVVEHSDVKGTATGGTAHWDATYPFSVTGNTVKNSIDATFTFKDGKILTHDDVFSFPKWATQAFGLERFGFFGRMIANSSLTQGALRMFARRGLKQFMQKKGMETQTL